MRCFSCVKGFDRSHRPAGWAGLEKRPIPRPLFQSRQSSCLRETPPALRRHDAVSPSPPLWHYPSSVLPEPIAQARKRLAHSSNHEHLMREPDRRGTSSPRNRERNAPYQWYPPGHPRAKFPPSLAPRTQHTRPSCGRCRAHGALIGPKSQTDLFHFALFCLPYQHRSTSAEHDRIVRRPVHDARRALRRGKMRQLFRAIANLWREYNQFGKAVRLSRTDATEYTSRFCVRNVRFRVGAEK